MFYGFFAFPVFFFFLSLSLSFTLLMFQLLTTTPFFLTLFLFASLILLVLLILLGQIYCTNCTNWWAAHSQSFAHHIHVVKLMLFSSTFQFGSFAHHKSIKYETEPYNRGAWALHTWNIARSYTNTNRCYLLLQL